MRLGMCPNLKRIHIHGILQSPVTNPLALVIEPFLNSCRTANILSLAFITFHITLVFSTSQMDWDEWRVLDDIVSEASFPALVEFNIILHIRSGWIGCEEEKCRLEAVLPKLKFRNVLNIFLP